MEYVKLKNTDLVVSRIGLGCEPLGGVDWGYVDERAAEATVYKALDLGINLFDTADVYGLGLSETRLSRALGPHRHQVTIITKFGVNWKRVPGLERAVTFRDSSPTHVVEALENSLRRLRLDCIPIYCIHWPDPKTPICDTIEVLQKCQQQGKIRYIGLSNFPLDLVRQVHSISPLGAVELQYNLLNRELEAEITACYAEIGVSVVAYGMLAQVSSPANMEQTHTSLKPTAVVAYPTSNRQTCRETWLLLRSFGRLQTQEAKRRPRLPYAGF